jgi:hypothetical protein
LGQPDAHQNHSVEPIWRRAGVPYFEDEAREEVRKGLTVAKRKKSRRLAGFGLTKAEHQSYAVLTGKDAKAWMRGVRTALDSGSCAAAIDRLVSAAHATGKMSAHSSSRSLSIKRRKPKGRGSMGGGGTSALYGLTRRVVRACAKERY